jgi:hypothetical protein
VIRAGAPAAPILLDAPVASAADDATSAIERVDIPAVSCVITDGVIRILRSRNATRLPQSLFVAVTARGDFGE